MVEQNEIFNLAERWVNETQENIFLTGKAGTGKTTFLRHIKSTTPKNAVVLAPTGVAAINAGGSTLHSFFRLPFATFIPDYQLPDNENVLTPATLFSRLRYSKQHIQLLRTVELLIIDEVSMVRADLLDMLDHILRRVRLAADEPFGGVQILFIGDMHQLPPVVKDYEARMLSDYYNSPYFFDSKVLRDNKPVIIQLTHVYRQEEALFLDLLNELRHNRLSEHHLAMLRSKVTPTPPMDEKYITLTSHVAKADRINEQGLARLSTRNHLFKATIEGEFPPFQYPTATELVLKKDARVMFVKNDPAKSFYNGKMGTVSLIEEDAVWVRCDEDGKELKVVPLNWDNVRYQVNRESGQVEEEVIGKFWQLPLRLAWAVTIHKSQGLTFDHVTIDAERAFAPGQVYVALSRCRKWEGIVLLSQIRSESLFTDLNILSFSEQIWQQEQLQKSLPAYRHSFQTKVLFDAFDLASWKRNEEQLKRLVTEFQSSLAKEARDFFNELFAKLTKLADVATRFRVEIVSLNNLYLFPDENEKLIRRINAASTYFSSQTEQYVIPALERLPPPPDNSEAASKMLQSLNALYESVQLQQAVWNSMLAEITIPSILQSRTKQLHALSKQPPLKWNSSSGKGGNNFGSADQALSYALRQWRSEKAEERNVEPYRIFSNKALDGLVKLKPANHKELLKVPGIGKKKTNEFGVEILHLLSAYYELKPEEAPEQKLPKKEKQTDGISSTVEETLLLLSTGRTAAEVASARHLSVITINGHIADLIRCGKLPVSRFMNEDKIRSLLKQLPERMDARARLGDLKQELGDQLSWDELKWVVAHRIWLDKEKEKKGAVHL